MVHQSADGSKMGGPPESGTTVPLDKTGLLMEGEGEKVPTAPDRRVRRAWSGRRQTMTNDRWMAGWPGNRVAGQPCDVWCGEVRPLL